ncbi:MAG: hypothetical protein QXW55_00720 [Candidatus Bathyarchaeia archaeon]
MIYTLVAIVPNVAFFILGVPYLPIKVFWTEHGWSYIFALGESYLVSSLPMLLYIIYGLLNYVWILKPIKSSRSQFIRKKYKLIFLGFSLFFALGFAISNTILYILPEAVPLGGITIIIGLIVMAYSISLEEKWQEIYSPTLPKGLHESVSLFLQKIFNSLQKDVLGQHYLKYDRYLLELGISDNVEISDGKITVKGEIDSSQLTKIVDKTLEKIEEGKLPFGVINDLINFWNDILPVIENDNIVLLKSHENFLKKNRLIYKIADGRFRDVFLPKGFSEDHLDGFSRLFGLLHKDLFGKPILMEINPSEKYEDIVELYIREVLANCEELTVFTRKGSKILEYLPREQAHIFYLSSEVTQKNVLSRREAELPIYDLAYLLGDISLAVKNMHSLLVDDLTDLIYSIGFKRSYRFTRSAIELASSHKIVSLFLISEAHDEKVKAVFENLFPIILRVERNNVVRIK